MLNVISLFIGVIAAVLAIFAFIPFLGWANWLILPVAVVGLIVGLLSRSKEGQTLNLVVIAIGCLRLFLGGGII
ncbi:MULTISPECIES: hypothetical protein [Sphingomonadales]|uniref:Uncharacterized protein n=2 Tax=Edaphosphingomonas TaxID=3423724 RepID=A0A2T4HR83_9SPHN|nr:MULTISPECIES: hypothetical protein [Sphingomonas]AGH48529.1 hypothetical protein G432_04010 [Sphingomonas sp. MM-1]MDX3883293.1 hypothetical protein [Sphingomonas sp.]OHT21005.1 hypothetical protein BHE75_03010 [Sphingomonas haloaromaticamans]PTD18304.1 hypothetical protein CV103_15450 [Sphingomonas fennica]